MVAKALTSALSEPIGRTEIEAPRSSIEANDSLIEANDSPVEGNDSSIEAIPPELKLESKHA